MIDPTRIQGAVLGIGCDLVDIERIKQMHERHGERCLDRIYTAVERSYCMAMKNPYPSLAARFAAKEAVSKAFGTGIGREFGLQSLSVVKGEQGEPIAELDEQGRALLKKLGGTDVLLSLSHTANQAMAFAVVVHNPH
ncbi:holo-ACP synthase [Cerasicoccus arenae]|uniref:Holo-[acyl-carrier-protein] synthase n=1 Tax=Cerasicoccus arenae TaxID=424488 RepID=A0A8J3DFF4_9BACT|nr:holo-ACP synthase [Cerasicoccus arenae]MBK1857247.1 holo-ACP synthase [Cerasicoccus arenae]GHC00254.1 holo-[acyl-carrier-protein] synthase [Cerasicoccus arenae]